MSARERFFKKIQQNAGAMPGEIKCVESEIRAFCLRMEELAQQVEQWFAGSGIEVMYDIKHIHDLSTVGYSLNSGICRYDILALGLRNGDRSVSILPEQLLRGAETGCVRMCVDAPGCASGSQLFYLSMAPETGWFIRREYQSVQERVAMTEDLFFLAIDRLA